jgi:hypothetical protein
MCSSSGFLSEYNIGDMIEFIDLVFTWYMDVNNVNNVNNEYISFYCTSVYEHHYKIFNIKIAIFLLFQFIFENFEILWNFIKTEIFENFEILWNFIKTEMFENFEILNFLKNFWVFVIYDEVRAFWINIKPLSNPVAELKIM